jgi:lipopolysaccharide/colanic/teichoic acid biosynthesis glycosyltransferase
MREDQMSPQPRVPQVHASQSSWRCFAKRVFDIICAAVGLIALSPLLAATALLIRLAMGSPVLYCQERPGKNGKPFRLLKFRTMTNACDANGNSLPDDQRRCPVGDLLRTTSIDELPQLWNILRGEMSLVGPRPLMMRYLPRYSPEQARRHEVKPGITGWAQIHGRNAIDWEEKLALDVWYVENWSLRLDLRIFATTIWRVLRREGISQDGCFSSTEFMGSNGTTPIVDGDSTDTVS